MNSYAEKILNLIEGSCRHMTAEQIFLELKKREDKVVLATVYNNLNALYAKNLIRKISIEGSPDRYDKIVRHDHLVCKKCGRLTDFGFDDLTSGLQQRLDGKVMGYDLKIYYLCPDCAKNKEEIK